MFYLAIESSCDETSLAILEFNDDTVTKNLSLHKFDQLDEFSKIYSKDKRDSNNFYSQINQIKVISSIISSQIEIHSQYGGVVPEVGARLHAEQIHGLFQVVLGEALDKLQISKDQFYNQLESIFVTSEPGLMSALRVGIEFAKSLQFYINKQYQTKVKLEFVDHLQGHVASCFYEMENNNSNNKKGEVGKLPLAKGLAAQTDWGYNSDAAKDYSDSNTNGDVSIAATDTTNFPNDQIFPHLHLMISGGNTQIRLLRSWQDWQIVGQTIDDAAGECFDKAARMVGIAYPGGATLSKIAGEQYFNPLSLPIAMLQSKDLNISLSGLKTAVRYKIQKAQILDLELDRSLTNSEIEMLKSQSELKYNPKLQFIKQICISTQFAIIEQIIRKIDLAIKQHQPKSIGISGGVSANQVLIQKIQQLKSIQSLKVGKVFAPDTSLTGDNAIMIGLAGLIIK